MTLHFARYSLMVSPVEIHSVLFHRLRDTFPSVLCKYSGVGYAEHVPPFHIRVFFFHSPNLFGYMVNGPLNALIRLASTAVQFSESVHSARRCHGIPPNREWLRVTPVKTSVDVPTYRNRERLNDMSITLVGVMFRRVSEFCEHLTGEHVPSSIPPRLTKCFWERFKLF